MQAQHDIIGVPEPKYKTSLITEEYDVMWEKSLGTGVNGDVVMCVRKDTGRKFALKCLRPRPESRREIALQFFCGQHPNIVRAFDVYENTIRRGPKDYRPPTRTLLMVLELMEGGELFDRIMDKKSFNEQEASAVIRQVVDAITFLHKHDIAHRDLKPENLLYLNKDEDSPLKLADFGFAKIDKGTLVTPVYTPYYVPPQILEAQRVARAKKLGILPQSHVFMYDKSCDMWSLGVILYIILCGYPPFQSEIPGAQLSDKMKDKIRTGHFTFHDKYWKHISKEAKDTVRKLLSTDTGSRMTAQELRSIPWISGVEVKAIVLMTPGAMMESKEERALAQAQFDEDLSAMRTKPAVQLKPFKDISHRLKNRSTVAKPMVPRMPAAGAAVPAHAVVPAAQSVVITNASQGEALCNLRDLCKMPAPGSGIQTIAPMISQALLGVAGKPEEAALKSALEAHGWNGSVLGSSATIQTFSATLEGKLATTMKTDT